MSLDPKRILIPALTLVVVLAGGAMGRAADSGVVEAARTRDVAGLRALVRAGADVNLASADGTTALAWAAHWDDHEAADLLLASGADPDLANDFGVAPLMLACENRSDRMVEKLLRAGADANAAQASGETVLMTCAQTGNADAVRWLIERGANVNRAEPWKGQTALMWATVENHAGVARLLIDQGADVEARTSGGFTALLFAAQQGAVETGQVLLDAGAKIDEAPPDGKTPLLIATSSGNTDFAKFLLAQGANANAADRSGYTALHFAVGRPAITGLIGTLIARGADPNARVKNARRRGGGISMVGATPLLAAADTGNVAAMRALAEAGADPKITTEEGTTLLQVALGVGEFFEREPAELARQYEAAQLAVELGADVNAVGEFHWTALHAAAYGGDDQSIEMLVERGAKLDVFDTYGQTPLSIAEAVITAGMADYADPRPRRYRETTVETLRNLGATPTAEVGVESIGSLAVVQSNEVVGDQPESAPEAPFE